MASGQRDVEVDAHLGLRAGPEDPAFALQDVDVVDAGLPAAHQALVVELPVLVAVAAEPLAGHIVPLVCEAHRDAVFPMGPNLLDEPVVKLARPFPAQELHDGLAGGHYARDITAHKFLRVGYYWPTLFKDAHSYVRKCQFCQIATRRQKKPSLPLQPINIDQPFDEWGLDIIGEIVPHSSKHHRYILTTIDYFTKW